jgi:putative flippase GtrA
MKEHGDTLMGSLSDFGQGLLRRHRTFVKYCMVGTCVTGLDFAIFNLSFYVLALGSVPAKLLAFSPAVIASYCLNRIWTFRSRDRRIHRQLLRFLAVSLVGAGVSSGLIYILLDLFHVHPFLANGITCSFVLTWNFLAHKYWTFEVPGRPMALQVRPVAAVHAIADNGSNNRATKATRNMGCPHAVEIGLRRPPHRTPEGPHHPILPVQ